MTETGSAHTLSSSQTFLTKVIVPIIWVGMFASITVSLFLWPESWHTRDGRLPPAAMRWVFLVATVGGSALFWWACVRLKRVRMDDRNLYISNYSTEIAVPLTNVTGVRENWWINSHPVTIDLSTPTEFGTSIVFMPKIRWFGFWSTHPVVQEIRDAVNRATAAR